MADLAAGEMTATVMHLALVVQWSDLDSKTALVPLYVCTSLLISLVCHDRVRQLLNVFRKIGEFQSACVQLLHTG